MSADPFDQAARFVARLDAGGFFAWLFPGFASRLRFSRWLDTRTASGPAQAHQIADTVAELLGRRKAAPPWLLLLEFQTEPDPEMFGRLLAQLGRFWREHRPDRLPGSRYQVAAAVVNLTGTPQSQPASRRYRLPLGKYGLSLDVREVYLAEESAEETLDRVEGGEVSASILAFVPLMKNGGDPATIRRWLNLTGREPNARRREDLGSAAEVLAELKLWFGAWRDALREWNMRESTVVKEWINVGHLEQARLTLSTLVEDRFGSVPADLAARIAACADADLLREATRQVYRVAQPADLLPG